jgi:hypothetical protein
MWINSNSNSNWHWAVIKWSTEKWHHACSISFPFDFWLLCIVWSHMLLQHKFCFWLWLIVMESYFTSCHNLCENQHILSHRSVTTNIWVDPWASLSCSDLHANLDAWLHQFLSKIHGCAWLHTSFFISKSSTSTSKELGPRTQLWISIKLEPLDHKKQILSHTSSWI